jgi:hypothetical protein
MAEDYISCSPRVDNDIAQTLEYIYSNGETAEPYSEVKFIDYSEESTLLERGNN